MGKKISRIWDQFRMWAGYTDDIAPPEAFEEFEKAKIVAEKVAETEEPLTEKEREARAQEEAARASQRSFEQARRLSILAEGPGWKRKLRWAVARFFKKELPPLDRILGTIAVIGLIVGTAWVTREAEMRAGVSLALSTQSMAPMEQVLAKETLPEGKVCKVYNSPKTGPYWRIGTISEQPRWADEFLAGPFPVERDCCRYSFDGESSCRIQVMTEVGNVHASVFVRIPISITCEVDSLLKLAKLEGAGATSEDDLQAVHDMLAIKQDAVGELALRKTLEGLKCPVGDVGNVNDPAKKIKLAEWKVEVQGLFEKTFTAGMVSVLTSAPSTEAVTGIAYGPVMDKSKWKIGKLKFVSAESIKNDAIGRAQDEARKADERNRLQQYRSKVDAPEESLEAVNRKMVFPRSFATGGMMRNAAAEERARRETTVPSGGSVELAPGVYAVCNHMDTAEHSNRGFCPSPELAVYNIQTSEGKVSRTIAENVVPDDGWNAARERGRQDRMERRCRHPVGLRHPDGYCPAPETADEAEARDR